MDYFIFSGIWLIAVLPKTIQFAILITIAIYFICKKKSIFRFQNHVIATTYLLVNTILLVAIIVSVLTYSHDTDRIFAAINTCLITYISLLFFSYYSRKELDIYKVSRYMFINMVILLLIYGLYLLIGLDGNYSFMNGALCGPDWINGKYEIRFRAYLEYTNLIIYMYLYCFPVSLIYVKKKFNGLFCLIYEVMLIAPIISSNSRTGIVCGIVMLVSCFILFNIRIFFVQIKKHKVLVFSSIILCLGLCILLFYNKIYSVIMKALAVRQDSTSTRMGIYVASLKKMWNESPILGCGIKDYYGGYPYGSHSTFVGMFYKTGILGGSIYLIGIIIFVINIIREKEKNSYILMIKISILCVFAISLLEDIDGSNWNIVMFMSIIAVFFANKKIRQAAGGLM